MTPNETRYQALIEAARRYQTLWIAESTHAVLVMPNDDGEALLVVWPTEAVAARVLASQPDLADFKPVPRTLDRWLNTTTPRLIDDGVWVGANPDESMACLRVPPADFARDLRDHASAAVLQGQDIARLQRKVAQRKAATRKT